MKNSPPITTINPIHHKASVTRPASRRLIAQRRLPVVPEILEVEVYRRAAESTVGRAIAAVDAADAWYLKGAATPQALRDALVGRTVVAARRRGKLLVLDTDGPALGLRFGMTGRLIVDGLAPIEELEYGSRRSNPAWRRFGLHFGGGGNLAIDDPRRLGGVLLEPDEEALGPDALSVTRRELVMNLAPSRAPVKAALMDQSRLAGVGNLIADETLWRAGI